MELERDFEKFTAGPTAAPGERLHVSLNRNNVLHFNNNVHRLMGSPEAICLYYSRTRDTIAMVPVSARTREGFLVKPNVNTGWRINISPFCRHFGIRIDTTIRFAQPEIDGTKILLSLSDTVVFKTVRQRKRSADRG